MLEATDCDGQEECATIESADLGATKGMREQRAAVDIFGAK